MALENSATPCASDMEAPGALPDGSSVIEDENQADNMLKEEEPWEVQRQKIPLRVDVEWLDFDHFKNRYTEKEGGRKRGCETGSGQKGHQGAHTQPKIGRG
ncbi:hypothetical protein NUW58_g7412 [Xylaria curta]|uniref:Uncharacterized protein n=1 Tax=Xylaria curta TaxID=42375 RepID=A0ACC1NJU3_9PEZI|nr:hypothetical protein NUW58_g7412 [Xylaria curta]